MKRWMKDDKSVSINEDVAEVFGRTTVREDEPLEEFLGEGKDRANIKHFANLSDFLLTNALVSVRHAFPEFNDDQAISVAKILMRRASFPSNEASWHRPRTTMNRLGMKGTLARVLLELSRGYYD